MTAGSSMLATIRTAPPQWTQVVTSMPNTRLRRCAHVIPRRFSSGLRGSSLTMQRESADLAGVTFQQTGVAGQRLQGDDFAPGLRASGDAVGDRTHPQRVHAVIATRAVGQEYGFVLAANWSGSFRQRPLRVEADTIIQLLNLADVERTAVGRPQPSLRNVVCIST